jgi:hypothetical protein
MLEDCILWLIDDFGQMDLLVAIRSKGKKSESLALRLILLTFSIPCSHERATLLWLLVGFWSHC